MKKQKRKTEEELLDVSKEHLKVSKRHLEVSSEHKDIGRKQLETSMPRNEQRLWQIIAILVMIIIGGGIYIRLGLGKEKIISKEYDVKVEVAPNEIRLNDKKDRDFIFTFTNTGTKNITDFDVTDILLYRIEKGVPTYLYPLYSDNQGSRISCGNYNLGLTKVALPVNSKCMLGAKLRGIECERCFDDKDKRPQFFIYIKSVPLIENEVLNLTIY